jgi:hypothetical protein
MARPVVETFGPAPDAIVFGDSYGLLPISHLLVPEPRQITATPRPFIRACQNGWLFRALFVEVAFVNGKVCGNQEPDRAKWW